MGSNSGWCVVGEGRRLMDRSIQGEMDRQGKERREMRNEEKTCSFGT